MFGMGPSEIIVVLVVALLIFGRRLPEVSRSMGRTVREFRRGMTGFRTEIDRDLREDE